MEQTLEIVNQSTGEVTRPYTAAEVKAQVNRIQEVMRDVMEDGQHYGKIPGCGNKPTLLKAGAEKLMMTFHLAADHIVTDLSNYEEIRFRVLTRILSPSGSFLGSGVGEASSNEEKYKWRKSICKEEFGETPEDWKREKWQKGKNNSTYKVQQIKTNPADVANTILKMAKKRAFVDATLTVLAASDIFTQDIEDFSSDTHEEKTQEKQPITPPQRKVEPNNGNGGGNPDTDLKAKIRSLMAQIQHITSQSESDMLEDFSAFDKEKDGKVESIYARDIDHLMKSDKWARATYGRMQEWLKDNMPSEGNEENPFE